MSDYLQISKQASWALFVVTLILAIFIFLGAATLIGLLALLQLLFGGGRDPLPLWWGVCIMAAVLLPAFFLAWFYSKTADHVPAYGAACVGWVGSAVYHAGLTWVFWSLTPASLAISQLPMKIPLALLSGASACTSLYLLLSYPRPPRLPSERR